MFYTSYKNMKSTKKQKLHLRNFRFKHIFQWIQLSSAVLKHQKYKYETVHKTYIFKTVFHMETFRCQPATCFSLLSIDSALGRTNIFPIICENRKRTA